MAPPPPHAEEKKQRKHTRSFSCRYEGLQPGAFSRFLLVRQFLAFQAKRSPWRRHRRMQKKKSSENTQGRSHAVMKASNRARFPVSSWSVNSWHFRQSEAHGAATAACRRKKAAKTHKVVLMPLRRPPTGRVLPFPPGPSIPGISGKAKPMAPPTAASG